VRKASRVSPQIVIAESLLREGAEYSEDDLRAASARLRRLPFLLSADFALEKGSERGRYLLAISVVAVAPRAENAERELGVYGALRSING